mgnify:CR=1 FL=1
MTEYLWKNLLKRTPPEKALHQSLRENILFEDLTSKQLRFVSNIVHLRKYRDNETIFRQGEVGVGMYIIVSGSVTISVQQDGGSAEKKAQKTIITRLGPGDFFGELSLVEENGRRSASAEAGETTELIGFFKPDLLEILERNPLAGVKITLRLGEVLGRRLRETTERVSALEEQLKENRAE